MEDYSKADTGEVLSWIVQNLDDIGEKSKAFIAIESGVNGVNDLYPNDWVLFRYLSNIYKISNVYEKGTLKQIPNKLLEEIADGLYPQIRNKDRAIKKVKTHYARFLLAVEPQVSLEIQMAEVQEFFQQVKPPLKRFSNSTFVDHLKNNESDTYYDILYGENEYLIDTLRNEYNSVCDSIDDYLLNYDTYNLANLIKKINMIEFDSNIYFTNPEENITFEQESRLLKSICSLILESLNQSGLVGLSPVILYDKSDYYCRSKILWQLTKYLLTYSSAPISIKKQNPLY